MRRTLSIAVLFLLPVLAACSPGESDTAAAPAVSRPTPAPVQPSTGKEPIVVFLGDSLTAGYGLEESQAYPVLVRANLEKAGHPVRVVNAGVSGDTTAGGLARLDWLLSQKPDVVVVALGGNDGLRGLPLEEAEKNLREIVRRSKEAGARVLLLGMQIPPNYGPEYANGFAEMYPRIAKEMDVPLVPFLLEGVGGIARLNQADGIHPTAEGQVKVAETVTPYLEKMLAD
ncbi:MAG TPA: arylesterase [Thermoanaerobaculia bacterium]|nr:arylesterase [Thermoanaerobaculia bacterium]